MDTSEYISNRIEGLTEGSEEVRQQSDVTNDFDTWSGLKLILHSAAVNMYTKVLNNQSYFNDLYYIDALAGSGVSTYDDGQSCFLGSPIIACKAAQQPFKKMYFIEKNEKKAKALKIRLSYVFSAENNIQPPNDWEVIIGDANEKMADVTGEIRKLGRQADGGYNYYCFIDNQSLDIKWNTIEELTTELYGDLLINLPIANSIGRNATKDPVPSDLNSFYCKDLSYLDVPDSNIRKFMKSVYMDCLSDHGRPIQEITNIDANVGSFEYDLVYATRDIEGGNDYMKVIEYVGDFIEDVHAGDVEGILDVLYNNQSTINTYMPDGDVDEQLPNDDSSNRSQSSISDFLNS